MTGDSCRTTRTLFLLSSDGGIHGLFPLPLPPRRSPLLQPLHRSWSLYSAASFGFAPLGSFRFGLGFCSMSWEDSFFQLAVWMRPECFSSIITFHPLGWSILQRAAPIYQGRLPYCLRIFFTSRRGGIMPPYPMEIRPGHVAWLWPMTCRWK